MAIQFHCTHCGALIEVDDQYAGGQCQCPACNSMAAIPQPAGTTPAGTAGGQPTPPPTPMPRMSPPTEAGTMLPPAEPGKKGWAVAALVCAIPGLLCFPFGALAILFAIVALAKASNSPRTQGGKGLAVSAIVISCVGFALVFFYAILAAVLLPSFSRSQELSKRTVCAANLRAMGTGFYTYANENNDNWPSPFDAEGELIPPGGVDYVGAIGSYRGKSGDPDAGDITRMDPIPDKVSTTRGLWVLIRLYISAPKSFTCPSSTDAANADANLSDYWDFGVGDITGPATAYQANQGWSQVSYGYQVPFGKKGRPSSNCDLRMPLAADKGPFGAALDGGTLAPPVITADQNDDPDTWKTWNSPNHGGQMVGEGQNVLFADTHVEWTNNLATGLENDNIYTQWSGDGTNVLDRVQGNPPTAGGRQTPAGDTDTLIYP